MATKKTVKKTAKKVTKKTATKAAQVAKILPFNKANAKLFADNIFSDNFGRVTFLKLCDGNLSNGKDGGRTLHCALGEAYFTFVNPHVAKFVNAVEKKHGESLDDNHAFNEEGKRWNPKYPVSGHVTSHIPTLAVADALVDAAHLRSKDPNAKNELARALLATMESNDEASACGLDIADNAQRAKDVADMWRSRVVPLLK
jgi:hypothetical protein